MWKDIGLGDWLFDLDDEAQLPGIVPAVLAMAKDRAASLAQVGQAQRIVHARQAAAMAALRKAL
jgi:hypothetical protein